MKYLRFYTCPLTYFLTSLVFVAATQAERELTYTEQFITLEISRKMAQSALNHCKKNGFAVAVSVVDARAQLKTVLVADGVFPHAVETSLRKARTAASRRMSTHLIAEENAHESTLSDVFHAIGLTSLGGGTPIFLNGRVIGGIGLAGAPGEDEQGRDYDLACLEAAYAELGIHWPVEMITEIE